MRCARWPMELLNKLTRTLEFLSASSTRFYQAPEVRCGIAVIAPHVALRGIRGQLIASAGR